MRKAIAAIAVAAALAAGAWFVFNRDGQRAGPATGSGDATAPLAFVPADTPYVFANLEPLPQDKLDAWLQQSEAAVEMWRTQFDQAYAKYAQADEASTAKPWLDALDAEFRGKTVKQSMQHLGLDLHALSAVYGVGLVPVARLALADPEAFRAFVARVEAKAGSKIPAAKIEDIDYWQFTDAEAPLRAILALQGKHLVLTLAPANDDSALRTLLGIERPAQSMQDGSALATLNRKYGYLPYASGYVDTTRLVALLTGAPSALETAFLAALDIQKPVVDATCQVEYAALAQGAPRFSFGYTTLDVKRSVGESHLELRDDLAKDLMALRAPMPGLDAAADSMFNFGLSLKLAQLPPLVSKWAGAVQSAPWKCASLQELNTAFADSSVQLNNPVVFAAAPVFEGLHAIATRFSMPQAGAEPDFAGKLLIGSPNPAALLAMGQNFVHEIGTLGLKPDGEVKPLPALPGMPTMSAHVAMTDHLLGVALGDGEEATLKQAMSTDPARQPLLVAGYSGEAFAQFFEQMQTQTATLEQDPAKQEEMRQAVEMMKKIYGMIRRIEMSVEFDETGVAFVQTAELN
jgi:hypothetical protein